ncbi:hypothetical protein [Mucisphaera sp.]|uniref:hypothetical protein n=1 Tax=Mucisphaera sp. TaxID=2913024 RepID=UPI003D151525
MSFVGHDGGDGLAVGLSAWGVFRRLIGGCVKLRGVCGLWGFGVCEMGFRMRGRLLFDSGDFRTVGL